MAQAPPPPAITWVSDEAQVVVGERGDLGNYLRGARLIYVLALLIIWLCLDLGHALYVSRTCRWQAKPNICRYISLATSRARIIPPFLPPTSMGRAGMVGDPVPSDVVLTCVSGQSKGT
jgi:hypothetical protein